MFSALCDLQVVDSVICMHNTVAYITVWNNTGVYRVGEITVLYDSYDAMIKAL